jgi:glutamyl-tRNA synthetase
VAFEHIKQPRLTAAEDYLRQTLPFLTARGIDHPSLERLNAALPLIRERARTFAEAAAALDYFFRELPEYEPAARAKFFTAEAAPLLDAAHAALGSVAEWRATELDTCVKNLAAEHQVELKLIAQPARVALTGRSASPGLFEVMEVLGRDLTLARLQRGAAMARGVS